MLQRMSGAGIEARNPGVCRLKFRVGRIVVRDVGRIAGQTE